MYIEFKKEKLSNGNEISYKITESGIAYHEETKDEIVGVLEKVRKSGERVRFFFGNITTGKDRLDEYDVMGTISNSTGRIKIPLLIKSISSSGGPALLDDCIVKITKDKRVLYKHPNYHTGKIEIIENSGELLEKGLTHGVTVDDKERANFESLIKAQNYVSYLKGERNSK